MLISKTYFIQFVVQSLLIFILFTRLSSASECAHATQFSSFGDGKTINSGNSGVVIVAKNVMFAA